MDATTSREQVAGILALHDLRFAATDDGIGFRLLFDTAGVFIRVAPLGKHVVITVTSAILTGIDPDGAGAAAALYVLNDVNIENRFVKVVFVDGDLLAAYDLLADDLQAIELLNAIYTSARVAEELGARLVSRLGGKTFVAALDAADDGVEFEVDDSDES